jgi:hypothetical protein
MITRAKIIALLAGIPVLLSEVTAARADDAAIRKQLKYQDKPGPGGKKCVNCTLFVKPGSCTAVPGKISANGWCVAYVQKT